LTREAALQRVAEARRAMPVEAAAIAAARPWLPRGAPIAAQVRILRPLSGRLRVWPTTATSQLVMATQEPSLRLFDELAELWMLTHEVMDDDRPVCVPARPLNALRR